MGDLCMGEEWKSELMIENQGDIDAEFEILPNDSPFGLMFDFDIKKSILK